MTRFGKHYFTLDLYALGHHVFRALRMHPLPACIIHPGILDGSKMKDLQELPEQSGRSYID